MGIRGQKPTPTHLKVLRGNPSKRPINKKEPRPLGNIRIPPDWMTDDQKEHWNYMIDNSPEGLLRRLDKDTLISYVQAVDAHKKASIALQTQGLVVQHPTTGAWMVNAMVRVQEKNAILILRFAQEMGFSPVSRARISTIKDVDEQDEDNGDEANPFAKFG